jgi:hypothetical protein
LACLGAQLGGEIVDKLPCGSSGAGVVELNPLQRFSFQIFLLYWQLAALRQGTDDGKVIRLVWCDENELNAETVG